MEEKTTIRKTYKITYEELKTKLDLKGTIKAVYDDFDTEKTDEWTIRIETEE